MEAYVKNSGDDDQVKDGKRKEKIKLDQDKEDFRWLVSFKQGRRVVWMILGKFCKIMTQSYVQGSDLTVFNEGRRSVGNKLIDHINQADPKAYGRMAMEDGKIEEENDDA